MTTRHLLISVCFLDGRYHGQTDSGQRREWPPSPFRLFQALVAGNARGRGLPGAVADALGWLEQLNAPEIIAPEGVDGQEVLTYVLNNLSDRNSRTPKTIRPTLLNGDRRVQYCWAFDPNEPGAAAHAGAVAAAARHIRVLGWGVDLAIGIGEVVAAVPGVEGRCLHFRPDPGATAGGVDLRVPQRGSLGSLRAVYAGFLSRYAEPGVTRLETAVAEYKPVRYVLGAARHYVGFQLVDDSGFVPVNLSLIAPLVGMVRDLAGDAAIVNQLGQEVIDRAILGHPRDGTTDRVSILPLPTVRDRGTADGQVRRLILAQAAGSDGALCRRLGELLDGRTLRPLDGEKRFPRPIRLERMVRDDAVVRAYTGCSRIWVSVTPVLLPGYDDRKQHRGDHLKRLARAEELVRKATRQAGLPDPQAVELSRVPSVSGALHAQAYRPREKLSHYPRYHVRLKFAERVAGPLAIGAGRHTGFGTLAAINVKER